MSKLNKLTLEKEDSFKDELKEGKYDKKQGKKKKGKWEKPFKGKKSNDISWHTKNGQMVKDFCSIPFNKMAGFPVDIKSIKNVNLVSLRFAYISSFFIDWWTGMSEDFRSIINNAATNLGTLVRARNSGATNYQFSDIYINIIMGNLDIFSTISYAQRFFKMTECYSTYNRLIPRMLFESMGMDYDDFISNIANYRGMFNILLAKASTLVIPDVYPIYQYVMSFTDSLYKDRDSNTGREQIYIIGKKFFHIYDPLGSTEGGMVRLMYDKDLDSSITNFHALTTGDFISGGSQKKIKFSQLMDILELQINSIITDEDCNIIMGDLIKAYGENANFLKLQPLSESIEQIKPEYSEEFLCMLHNSTCIPEGDLASGTINNKTWLTMSAGQTTIDTGTRNNIKQDAQGNIITDFNIHEVKSTGNILMDPDNTVANGQLLFDTNDSNPSPEKCLLMSRLHCRFDISSGGNDRVNFKIKAGSAVILFTGKYYVGDVANGTIERFKFGQFYDIDGNQFTFTNMRPIFDLQHFEWLPVIYVHNITNNNVFVCSNINNVVNVSDETISNMHYLDMCSLLNVPYSGSF